MARKATHKACHCGHHIGDPAIQEEPEYGFIGWLMLALFGVTLRPKHISFRCMYCREELGTSRDPKLLARRTQPKASPAI
jgi:hypothetical protein